MKVKQIWMILFGSVFLILLGLTFSEWLPLNPNPSSTPTSMHTTSPTFIPSKTPTALSGSIKAPSPIPTPTATPTHLPPAYSAPILTPTTIPTHLPAYSASTPVVGFESEPTALPLVSKTQPLPHDGLFVRRHNDFGKKTDTGVKELINQGKLPEQIDIHFDDFVTLSSYQALSPESGKSIAVSYGLSPIPLSQKRDERATHYLAIALKASDSVPEISSSNQSLTQSTNQGLPANYVFVVDTSGSMEGAKLNAVKSSIRELFSMLKPDDRLGIVKFNEWPSPVYESTTKRNIDVNRLSEAISNLTAGGGTDLNLGLQYGINQINPDLHGTILNNVFLFSDGEPTSGVTDWVEIHKNLESLDTRNIHISTFAFSATDVNTRELERLAGKTGGVSSIVINPEDIQLNLEAETNRRDILAAVNIQMRIEIDQNIQIMHFYGHDHVDSRPDREAIIKDIELEMEQAKAQATAEFGVIPQSDIVMEDKGIRVFVPDLAVGDIYWLVFELAIPEGEASPLGTATVLYVDTMLPDNAQQEIPLLFSSQLSPDLVVQIALDLWTSEVIYYALDDLHEQDRVTANTRIKGHIDMLSLAYKDLDLENLLYDITTLKNFLSNTQNLGKCIRVSDIFTSAMGEYCYYALNEYGRVKNGFSRGASTANE